MYQSAFHVNLILNVSQGIFLGCQKLFLCTNNPTQKQENPIPYSGGYVFVIEMGTPMSDMCLFWECVNADCLVGDCIKCLCSTAVFLSFSTMFL